MTPAVESAVVEVDVVAAAQYRYGVPRLIRGKFV